MQIGFFCNIAISICQKHVKLLEFIHCTLFSKHHHIGLFDNILINNANKDLLCKLEAFVLYQIIMQFINKLDMHNAQVIAHTKFFIITYSHNIPYSRESLPVDCQLNL